MNYTALGLKNPKVNTPLPETKFTEGSLSIQEHLADRAGPHYDLRLALPETGIAHSWAIPQARMPMPGEKVLAVESGDHDLGYMSFSGTLGKGYGKGRVNLKTLDKVEVLESDPNKITFVQYTGSGVNRYTLVRMLGKDWLLLNTTATNKTRPEIPQFKRSYQELNEAKLKNLIKDENVLLAPKIDGAHVIIGLRPERRLDVFSYRPSKKGVELIDHSFKTDLYKTKSPNILGKTILRGELFGLDPKTQNPVPSATTGGLLNSGTWRSRELQKNQGKLDHLIYDIDTFRGKDVSGLPYREKLELLELVKTQIPELKMVQPARTIVDKVNLFDQIQTRTHPQTQEGLIAYNLNEHVPKKYKLTKDIDVYFKEPFAPLKGSRLEQMGAAGGFWASRTPDGPAVIRVGTGLDDAMRKDIMLNAQKYKGRPAKIYIQDEFSSGKVRMPVLKEFRDYEMWEKTGASKLRSMIKIVESPGLFQGGKEFQMMLGEKTIGNLGTFPQNWIRSVHIEEPYRNLGLGKKLYGEVIKREGYLLTKPDFSSTEAKRVWSSLRNRYPHYDVTLENPISVGGKTDKKFIGVKAPFEKKAAVLYKTNIEPIEFAKLIVDKISKKEIPDNLKPVLRRYFSYLNSKDLGFKLDKTLVKHEALNAPVAEQIVTQGLKPNINVKNPVKGDELIPSVPRVYVSAITSIPEASVERDFFGYNKLPFTVFANGLPRQKGFIDPVDGPGKLISHIYQPKYNPLQLPMYIKSKTHVGKTLFELKKQASSNKYKHITDLWKLEDEAVKVFGNRGTKALTENLQVGDDITSIRNIINNRKGFKADIATRNSDPKKLKYLEQKDQEVNLDFQSLRDLRGFTDDFTFAHGVGVKKTAKFHDWLNSLRERIGMKPKSEDEPIVTKQDVSQVLQKLPQSNKLKIVEEALGVEPKQASVLDPVQSTLCPEVFNTDTKIMHPEVRGLILYGLMKILGPETFKVTGVLLLGGSVTYQWTMDTDIDVNVNIDEKYLPNPEDYQIYQSRMKSFQELKLNQHPVNYTLKVTTGEDESSNLENTLALYDVLNNTWIKEPDPNGVNLGWMVEMNKPFLNLSKSFLNRGMNSLEESIARGEPEKQILRNATDVTEAYKKFDVARKLSYRESFGIPNISEANVFYKYLSDDKRLHRLEDIYHAIKPKLLKGWYQW